MSRNAMPRSFIVVGRRVSEVLWWEPSGTCTKCSDTTDWMCCSPVVGVPYAVPSMTTVKLARRRARLGLNVIRAASSEMG